MSSSFFRRLSVGDSRDPQRLAFSYREAQLLMCVANAAFDTPTMPVIVACVVYVSVVVVELFLTSFTSAPIVITLLLAVNAGNTVVIILVVFRAFAEVYEASVSYRQRLSEAIAGSIKTYRGMKAARKTCNSFRPLRVYMGATNFF